MSETDAIEDPYWAGFRDGFTEGYSGGWDECVKALCKAIEKLPKEESPWELLHMVRSTQGGARRGESDETVPHL